MDIIKKFGSLVICSLGLLSLTRGQQVSIVPSEKTVRKFVNDSYFVSCTTADGQNKADWFNPNNKKVDKSIHSRIRVETDYGVELFLTRITTQDAGQYMCSAKGGRAGFNLTVIRPIVFDPKFAEQSAPEGDNFKMQCKAQGQSTPKIYWKVDARTPNPPKYKIMRDGLLIHNVSQQDGKVNYVCRAMDMDSPMPDAKIMNITLKVKMKPRMVGNDKKTEHWGVLGEWANLTCAVIAEPPPTFEWSHRNQSLSSSDEVFIMNENNVSILQVLVRNEAKFGVYTCKAKNELGSLERNMHLYKGQKPPPPVLQAEVVGHEAAKIRVIQAKSGADRTQDSTLTSDERKKGRLLPITGYVVQYKMATRGDWITANVTEYNGGFILKGLTPQITYHIRAASKNVASVGDFSTQLRIITPKDSPWVINTAANHLHSVFTVAINVAFHCIVHIAIRL